MRISERTRDGYGTAVAGAVVGGTLLGVAAYLLVALWVVQNISLESQTVVALVLMPQFAAPAMWLGSLLGCWVALRSRGHTGAGRTTGLLAPLMLAWIVYVYFVIEPFNNSSPAPLYFLLVLLILVVVPACAALLARYLALRR